MLEVAYSTTDYLARKSNRQAKESTRKGDYSLGVVIENIPRTWIGGNIWRISVRHELTCFSIGSSILREWIKKVQIFPSKK